MYADFGEGEIYFIISNVMHNDGFQILLSALYYLYPNQWVFESANDFMEYKVGICEQINGEYVVTKICDDISNEPLPCEEQDIPWKASFTWDEEGSCSNWTIERTPNEDKSFDVKVHITIHRNEVKEYNYCVKYEDLCYAVADACTRALKKHGFTGYNRATYTEDLNLRQLLFVKSIALGVPDTCNLTYYEEKGKGETSDFSKELEVRLFDM